MSAPLQPAMPKEMPNKMPRARATALVLALAFITRLLPFLSLLAHHTTTWIYTRGLETGFVAHSLLIGEGFASPFGGHTGPTALISPGYVLLVTAIFRIFGEASTASAAVILLAQIALGVLTTWLVMMLAGQLAGVRAALIAGSFFALWPPLLWVPTIFWDTSFTLCLIPALLLFALHLRERPSLARWLAFGALSGFAVLINLALSPTVAAIFCWAVWVDRSAPKQPRNALLAALLALAIYSPWPIRNEFALHSFIPLRTTVGLELWMGNREGATGYLDESIFPFYNRAELTRYLQRGEVAYMQDKSDAAKAAIRNHPSTFAALTARRITRFWFGSGNQHGAPLYIVGAVATTLLGLAGLATLYRLRHSEARVACLLLAIPLLLFPLPYYITHAEFRYRLALDPLLTALAACFIALRAPVVSPAGEPDPTPIATPEAA